MSTRQSRRIARAARWQPVTGVALGMTLLLTGCGGSAGAGGDAASGGRACGTEEPVSLTFSWWGSDTRHAYTQQLIDLFEESHPNVTIEGTFTGWSGYWDRLATSVAGGDTPDIIQMESRYVREYADRGALLDLSEYVPDVIDDSAFDENVVTSGQVEGATYGIPTGVNAFAIVADPQVFADAGVPMPDDDTWTWEDYEQVSTAISAGAPDGVWGTQDKGFNDANLEVFARQRGESLYTEDGRMGISAETIADWWRISLDLVASGGEPSASISVEDQAAGLDQSLVATRRGAMQFNWTNELPAISTTSGRDLQLLRLPGESSEERPGSYAKPAMFLSASAETECPDVAAEFIDFLLNDPEAAQLTGSDRGMPVNTELREQVVSQLPPADQKSAEFLERIEPHLAEVPPLPPQGAGEFAAILERYNEQVLFGQLSPEDAAQQVIAETSSAIG